ncbi:MAG: hypothetical protein J5584_10515 [Clostridia bacterium]|nr:hypothetical protein [Clostridia bacterium]
MRSYRKRVLIAVLAALAALLLFTLIPGCRKAQKTVRRDISGDSPYSDSVLYANDSANGVQVTYTDGDRHGVKMQNLISRFESDLTTSGNMGLRYFANSKGKNYFEDSLDLYAIDNDGTEWTDRGSTTAGRFNTTRLGYYYYETRVQEYSFGLTDPEAFVRKTPVTLADFTENWDTSMVSITQEAGKKITINIESLANAYILKSGLSVPAESATTIKITMAVKGSCQTAIFAYIDSATGKFNNKQRQSFDVINDGKYHTYYIDISDALKEELTAFRLEFHGEDGDVATVTEITALSLGTPPPLKTNRIYHIFPDKLHQEVRFLAAGKVDNIKEYGIVLRLPANTVDKFQIRDASGVHNDLSFDPATVQYAGFHVKGVGVVGFIIPDIKGNTKAVTVELVDGMYVIRQIYGGALVLKSGTWATLCNRFYTDESDSFEGIDRAAEDERDPLTGITVTDIDSGCNYSGYDKIRGIYLFEKGGTDFSTAYYMAPNRYFSSKVEITNNTSRDRNIYMCFRTVSGALECAALADKDGQYLLPIPIEVCKNFCGEFEDPTYDPADASYGDSYFPLVVKSGETTGITELHMYQNWGKYPLKQLSSIQFHVGYYHLSTGVSESNCIAPYYVYGKDGWILPDFRGRSSIMWRDQPQFNSVGVTKLVSHYRTDGTYCQSEYTGSKINSYGPTYADVEYSYAADDGSYEYTVRHIEFPQTDESRTYYTLDLKFNKDLTIAEVRRDFALLMFHSHFTAYHNFTYTDAGGKIAVRDNRLGTSAYYNEYTKFRKGSFWYTWNYTTEPSWENPLNYGVVVRDYSVKIGGSKWNGNFAVKHSCDGIYNAGCLTLDIGKATFRKGDYIRMSFILLPWGNTDLDSVENMQNVYEDSVTSPIKVKAQTGTAVNDKWLARVRCADNVAEFTVTGGRNNMPVRVDGFTSPYRPEIYIKSGGAWEPYSNAVGTPYDSYMIHFNDDGTYGFSFIVEQQSPGDSVSFRVVGSAPEAGGDV